MRRRTVLAGAVIPLVLVLPGCGSDKPKPAPPETSSASPSASPSVVAPTMPAEAKGTGPEAAKAFARHFIALLNYSEVTGDLDLLRQSFDPDCDGCSGIVDGLDKVYRNGGSVKTDGWEVKGLKTTPTPRGFRVDAMVDVAPQIVILERGAKAKRFPGDRSALRRLFLRHGSSAWVVSNMDEG